MKRKIARQEALEWSNAVKAESDEEREKKKRPRKVKAEGDVGSGDDAEVKKKKRGRPRKEVPANGNGTVEIPPDEEEAVFSGAEDDKPKKVSQEPLMNFDLMPWIEKR
jgi:RNA polymerase-associated protein CTR9